MVWSCIRHDFSYAHILRRFKEVSPLGKVPVIQHNGKTIWESAIIMEYLDEAFPGVRLLGYAMRFRV
jgi:glutathione S-transferase